MKTLLTKLLLPSFFCLSAACTDKTIDEDRRNRDEPDTENTQVTQPTPVVGTDVGERTTGGTYHDSMKTAANPLYKGDNRDTGKLRERSGDNHQQEH